MGWGTIIFFVLLIGFFVVPIVSLGPSFFGIKNITVSLSYYFFQCGEGYVTTTSGSYFQWVCGNPYG